MENGPFIDGLPIKNGDFPWRTVKSPEGNHPIRVETPGETPKKWEFTSKTGGFTCKSLAKSEDFNHKSLEKYGEIWRNTINQN